MPEWHEDIALILDNFSQRWPTLANAGKCLRIDRIETHSLGAQAAATLRLALLLLGGVTYPNAFMQ